MELSENALDDIFDLSQQVAKSQVTLTEAAKNLCKSHGIKETSGSMTLSSVGHLLGGEVYKRALTIQIVEYVLSRVNKESGVAGLSKSLEGLSAHIDYRNSGGVKVPGLQTVLAKFSK
jgi:5-methylcytosine-specific restriction protein A